jgi:hypothetical protein
MESSSPTAPFPTSNAPSTANNDGSAQAGARDVHTQPDNAQRQIDLIRQQQQEIRNGNMRRAGPEQYNQTPPYRETELRLLHRYHDRQREYQDARHNLNRLRSESRTAQNFSNVFGTREEVERLGDDYQSPVGNLFMSAYGANSRAEELRRSQPPSVGTPMPQPGYPPLAPTGQHSEVWETLNAMGDPVPPGPPNPHGSIFGPPAEVGANSPRFPGVNTSGLSFIPPGNYAPYIPATPPLYGLPSLASQYGTNYAPQQSATNPGVPNVQPTSPDFNPERAFYDRINRGFAGREATHIPTYPRHPEFRGLRESARTASNYANRYERRNRQHDSDASDYHYDLLDEMDYEDSIRDHPRVTENYTKGLDNAHDGRPEPKTEEQLRVNLDCKVCFSQLVDTVLLPCGHAVMCQWCANQHVPSSKYDKTRPSKPAKCPMCRKGIKQKVQSTPLGAIDVGVNPRIGQNAHRVTRQSTSTGGR